MQLRGRFKNDLEWKVFHSFLFAGAQVSMDMRASGEIGAIPVWPSKGKEKLRQIGRAS